MTKRLLLAAVVLILIAGVAIACYPPAEGSYNDQLLDATNRDRAAAGLPALTWNATLGGNALVHATHLAETGSLQHQNLTAILADPKYAAFNTLGENIAVAPAGTSAVEIERAFMASAPHRANILNRNFRWVGVAAITGNGQVWIAVEFGG
jgi:uncharacterized protein YkwD